MKDSESLIAVSDSDTFAARQLARAFCAAYVNFLQYNYGYFLYHCLFGYVGDAIIEVNAR